MTSPVIVSIVEGQGEVQAVRLLLQRVAEMVAPGVYVDFRTPHHLPRTKIAHRAALEQAIGRVVGAHPDCTGILLMFDADKDCPVKLAESLIATAAECRGDRTVCAVIPVQEYEAWFLAAAPSLSGYKGLAADLKVPKAIESF